MNEINIHIGSRIRNYRRMKGMTLQQLADTIHKSRATVSKYETGEITIDIETLYDISSALEVDLNRITDYRPAKSKAVTTVDFSGRSAFFHAERLYFYFYDGRNNRLKDGIIDVHKDESIDGCFGASLSIRSVTPAGRVSEVYYSGNVLYSDTLIRFSFENQYNKLEHDLLYIFNPLELRDFTEGLLCGISSADLRPCAFKCLVTLTPQQPSDELKQQLLISPKELRRWQKMNMFIVDNHS